MIVSRALEHFEATKIRHNLEMINKRLLTRLTEINQLATLDEKLGGGYDPALGQELAADSELDLIASN